MLRCDEMNYERILPAARAAGRPLRTALRAYALGMALWGLVAGSVLLPAAAAAATQDAKRQTAAAPAKEKRKVSPYLIAARQRMEAARAAGARPMQRPIGQPMKTNHAHGGGR